MKKECYISIVFFLLVSSAGCSGNVDNATEQDPKSEPVGSMPDTIEPDIEILKAGEKISQLIGDYDREREQATVNKTYSRYQLRSTDLGVPFQFNGKTYVLFGDTHGAGTPNGDAIAYTDDINPEDGLKLNFVENEYQVYQPVTIEEISQKAFEVPMEGVMVDGKMYIYHTTDHSPETTMGRSVLAQAAEDKSKRFNYLYDVSVRHFINISVVKVTPGEWQLLPDDQEGLVMFGSGRYRESNVHLAYQPTSGIEKQEEIQYFVGVDENDRPMWSSEESDAIPLFNQACVGELSASYNAYINRWILLYNCNGPRGINIRTAEYPWGPWTKPQVIFDPWEDDGYCHYMHTNWEYEKCDSVHDPGRENVWGGEYGPYQFEEFAAGDSLSTTIYFTMSTWNPYTVVLMKARLGKKDE